MTERQKTLKLRYGFGPKSPARAIMKKMLLISKDGTSLMLNFLQTQKNYHGFENRLSKE